MNSLQYYVNVNLYMPSMCVIYCLTDTTPLLPHIGILLTKNPKLAVFVK